MIQMRQSHSTELQDTPEANVSLWTEALFAAELVQEIVLH